MIIALNYRLNFFVPDTRIYEREFKMSTHFTGGSEAKM